MIYVGASPGSDAVARLVDARLVGTPAAPAQLPPANIDPWIGEFYARRDALRAAAAAPATALPEGKKRQPKRTADDMLYDEIAATLKRFGMSELGHEKPTSASDVTVLQMAKNIAETKRSADKENSCTKRVKSMLLKGEELLGRNQQPFLSKEAAPDVRRAGIAFIRASASGDGGGSNAGCGRDQQQRLLKELVTSSWGGEVWDEMALEVLKKCKISSWAAARAVTLNPASLSPLVKRTRMFGARSASAAALRSRSVSAGRPAKPVT